MTFPTKSEILEVLDWGFCSKYSSLKMKEETAIDFDIEILNIFNFIKERAPDASEKKKRIRELTAYVEASLGQLLLSADSASRQRLIAQINKTLVIIRKRIEFFPGALQNLPPVTHLADVEVNPSLRMKWKGMGKTQRTLLAQMVVKDFEKITTKLIERTSQEFREWIEFLTKEQTDGISHLTFDLSAYKISEGKMGPVFTVIEKSKYPMVWVEMKGKYYEVPENEVNKLSRITDSLATFVKGNEYSLYGQAIMDNPSIGNGYWSTNEKQNWKCRELGPAYQWKYKILLDFLQTLIAGSFKECKVLRSFKPNHSKVMELFGGDGELAGQILSQFPNTTYHLSDLNSDAIESARKRLTKFGNRVQIRNDDSITEDLQKASHENIPDIVIICGGLTHCVLMKDEDSELILKKIYSLLPIKGFVILNGHQSQLNSKEVMEEYFHCHNTSHPRCYSEQLFVLQKRQYDEKELRVRNGKRINFFHFMQRSPRGRSLILKEKIKDLPDHLELDLSRTNVTPEELQLLIQHFKKSPKINLTGVQMTSQHLDALKSIPKCDLNLSQTNVTKTQLQPLLNKLNSLRVIHCPQISVKDQLEISTIVALKANPLNPELPFLVEPTYREPENVDYAMGFVIEHMHLNPKAKLTLKDFLPGPKIIEYFLTKIGMDRLIFDSNLYNRIHEIDAKRTIHIIQKHLIETFGNVKGSPNTVFNFDMLNLISDFKPNEQTLIGYLYFIQKIVSPEKRSNIRSVKGIVPKSAITPLKLTFPNIQI